MKIIFKKINALTDSTTHKENFGKVINILANGLTAIENKLYFLFYLVWAPVGFTIAIWILWLRFEVVSIPGIVSLVLMFPLSYIIAKLQ